MNPCSESLGPRSNGTLIDDCDHDAKILKAVNNFLISSFSADSGRYIKPIAEGSITYEWHTPRIDSKDVFIVLMEVIMNIAHDGCRLPFYHLNAVSSPGRCTLNLRETGRECTTEYEAATLLFMLASMTVEQKIRGPCCIYDVGNTR